MTGDMVTLPRAQVELLAKAARLFQQVFDFEMDLAEAIDAAIECGMTVDRDLDEPTSRICGLDTEVVLSEQFTQALRTAEEACALIPAEPEPCPLE